MESVVAVLRLASGFTDGLQLCPRLSQAAVAQHVSRARSCLVLRLLRYGNYLEPTARARDPGEYLHDYCDGEFEQSQSRSLIQVNREIIKSSKLVLGFDAVLFCAEPRTELLH